jgi:hypothetical protein
MKKATSAKISATLKSVVSAIVKAIASLETAKQNGKQAILTAAAGLKTEDDYNAARPFLVSALKEKGYTDGTIRVYCSLVREGAGLKKANKGNRKASGGKDNSRKAKNPAIRDAINATVAQVAVAQKDNDMSFVGAGSVIHLTNVLTVAFQAMAGVEVKTAIGNALKRILEPVKALEVADAIKSLFPVTKTTKATK